MLWSKCHPGFWEYKEGNAKWLSHFRFQGMGWNGYGRMEWTEKQLSRLDFGEDTRMKDNKIPLHRW